LFLVVLSLNHLLGRFGFLKSAVTGRSTAIIEATELELDLNVVEALAGTAMALVPRVMERIWKDILNREGNRKLWQEIEILDQKKAKDGLSQAEREKFDDCRGSLKEVVRRVLGGRIKYISYSGAAMPPRIMRFFDLAGNPLIGSNGSNEFGGVTLCGIGENRLTAGCTPVISALSMPTVRCASLAVRKMFFIALKVPISIRASSSYSWKMNRSFARQCWSAITDRSWPP
jgi:long-subunit acyl-CoA synthetase (AMP-forming)